MKKLSTLVAQREALLRQARLANLAYAYQTLTRFEHVIRRAGLRGRVTLCHAAPEEERYWASLTALDGSQSVIEEHFSDADLMDLADMVSFATGDDTLDVTFPLEELSERFLTPLREELEHEGIAIDAPAQCPDALPGRGDPV
jgi:hypothetical protein